VNLDNDSKQPTNHPSVQPSYEDSASRRQVGDSQSSGERNQIPCTCGASPAINLTKRLMDMLVACGKRVLNIMVLCTFQATPKDKNAVLVVHARVDEVSNPFHL
jgi:hypothetical protein